MQKKHIQKIEGKNRITKNKEKRIKKRYQNDFQNKKTETKKKN